MNMGHGPYYLASASPRRLELLRQIGIEPQIIVKETVEQTKGRPTSLVTANALAKAKAAAADLAGRSGIVIAADTVVVLSGRILGKPQDEREAFAMLSALSGREHAVYSGVALIDLASSKIQAKWAKTKVSFRRLSPQEIEAYIADGEPMDKAGAYGIQGRGALLVRKINGDYYNVVGLPLGLLYEMLASW